MSRDAHVAATTEALRRIRELEAINAQITRHRDQLVAAIEAAMASVAKGTRRDAYEILAAALRDKP